MRGKWQLRIVFLFTAILLILFYKKFGIAELITLENLKLQQNFLQSQYSDDPFLFLFFFLLVYIVFVALSIPGAVIFTIAAGAIFGLFWGTIIISISSTVGATMSFGLARYLLRNFLSKKFEETFKKVDQGIKREGIFYLFTLRLVPIAPFFLVNLVMGLTAIRVFPYFVVSLLGMLPGTALYVNAGTQLAQITSIKDIFSPGMIFSFALLGLMPLFSHWTIQWIQSNRYLRKYKKPKSFDYNIVVLGGGAAGLSSAYIASTVKAKVALVEKHKMGGDCLNTGCIPSKSIIHSAKIFHHMKIADRWGLEPIFPKLDFSKVIQKVEESIQSISPKDSMERYRALGVDCFSGEAKLISPYEVQIDGKKITTKNIILATGASPVIPNIPGLPHDQYFTSDTIWSIKSLPKRLLIMGGGPIGCEFAQTFARLGSNVVMVERGARLLPREDKEISEVIEQKFRSEGIQVFTRYTVEKIIRKEGCSICICTSSSGKEEEIEFDTLLFALGRKPNASNFGLEELGIDCDERGSIITNEHLQSLKYPNIFAVGDVVGPYQFTHTASYHAGIAVVNALFRPWVKWKLNYSGIPWCTFTDPEVARVGLNKQEIESQGIPHRVSKFPLDDLDRAIAEKETLGFVEIISEEKSDRILGATIVGAHAGEMIAEFVLAMKYKIGLNKILQTIHIYPTWTEANKLAAGVWKKKNVSVWALSYLAKFHAWKLK